MLAYSTRYASGGGWRQDGLDGCWRRPWPWRCGAAPAVRSRPRGRRASARMVGGARAMGVARREHFVVATYNAEWLFDGVDDQRAGHSAEADEHIADVAARCARSTRTSSP